MRSHYPLPLVLLSGFRVAKGGSCIHLSTPALILPPSFSSTVSLALVSLYQLHHTAIHCEEIPDLMVQSFIWCLKVSHMQKKILDNRTTFNIALKMLQNIVNHPGVEGSLSQINTVDVPHRESSMVGRHL